MGVSFLTFGVSNCYVSGLDFLRLGFSNAYVWWLFLLRLGVSNSFVLGLHFFCLGISNSFVRRSVNLTFGDSFFTFGGKFLYVLGVSNSYDWRLS